ncbi:MAG: tyrosine-type recombinase/integrase [Elusimicrobia bacterium]|nr:tyrosine-type recombinase/integrase [Elusimicrobiota bacterium]MDE2237461.1 tyrosine-type recombinase/integrase [Elusimicrobiota bacterium]MDE2424431.1 tyrosine-type recombinase/integrase [Elusimicrobiota bacterium]
MELTALIDQYVSHRRSIGMRFANEPEVLKAFCRAMGAIDISAAAPEAVLRFVAGSGPLTSNWHRKFSVLNGLFRFAISHGYIERSPMPTVIPKRLPPCAAYIYSEEDLRRLVAGTALLKSGPGYKAYIRPETFRAVLCTLYATGLRVSEVCSLTMADVDLAAQVFTVRNSKFYKTRLVPIGSPLASVLRRFFDYRREFPMLDGTDSAFFSSRMGTPMTPYVVGLTFRKIRARVGLRREGTRYQPRIHDFRHTFAVRRLESWYRQGADVQQLLPALSTYLGHVNICGTQRYLSMTPELLREASRRFESYAGVEVRDAR